MGTEWALSAASGAEDQGGSVSCLYLQAPRGALLQRHSLTAYYALGAVWAPGTAA